MHRYAYVVFFSSCVKQLWCAFKLIACLPGGRARQVPFIHPVHYVLFLRRICHVCSCAPVAHHAPAVSRVIRSTRVLLRRRFPWQHARRPHSGRERRECSGLEHHRCSQCCHSIQWIPLHYRNIPPLKLGHPSCRRHVFALRQLFCSLHCAPLQRRSSCCSDLFINLRG